MNSDPYIPLRIIRGYELVEQVDIQNEKNNRYFRLRSRQSASDRQSTFLKVMSHDDMTIKILNRIAQDSSSDNINVPVLFFAEDNDDYLLSPYFGSGDFRSHLDNSEMPDVGLDEFRRVVRQLNAALTDLHSNCNLIHCDLKPSNILVEKHNGEIQNVCLNDFDYCVDCDDEVRHRRGYTPRYAAPELLNPDIPVEPGVDYWALGMFLFEWVTGNHVFEGINDAQVNLRLSGELEIEFQSIESTEMRALIAGLLHKDTGLRFDTGKVSGWLNSDISIITEGLGYAGEPCASQPFQLGPTMIYSATVLSHALLDQNNTQALTDPALLAWLTTDLGRPDIATLFGKYLTDETNSELALLKVVYDLWPGMPPVWRQLKISTDSVIDACSKILDEENSNSLDWLTSLIRNRPVFDFFLSRESNHRFHEVITIAKTIREAVDDYDQSWATIIERGAPAEIRPDSASQESELAVVTRYALDSNFQQNIEQMYTQLFDPRILLFRQDWFYTFGTSRDLSVAKMLILQQLDDISLLGVQFISNPADLEAIENDTFADSVIFFTTQEKLSRDMTIQPDTELIFLEEGEPYDEENSFSFRRFAGDITESAATSFNHIVTTVRGWIGNSAGNSNPEDGVPDDAETNRGETAFNVRFAPLVSEFLAEGLAPIVHTHLLRVSWRIPSNHRANLTLRSGANILSKPILKLKNLPHQGHVLLTVYDGFSVVLTEKLGFFSVQKHDAIRVNLRQFNKSIINSEKLPNFHIAPVLKAQKLRKTTRRDLQIRRSGEFVYVDQEIKQAETFSHRQVRWKKSGTISKFRNSSYTFRDRIRFNRIARLAKQQKNGANKHV